MKTLMLFEPLDEDARFFEFEGDLSHFNGVFIGSSQDIETEEALDVLLFNSDGSWKVTPLEQPTKDWDVFVHCGCSV